MARHPRYAAPGLPQHVTQRGNNRSPMFVSEADYRAFHEWLRIACRRYGCLLHAYVFMTNHVHLLVTPGDVGAIGRVVQSVGRQYVRHFNDTYRRSGTLWEGRYKATVVEAERYLFTCYRYIELNPVRAGIVQHPRAYRWSSHSANAYGVADTVVTPHVGYMALGADDSTRQTAYRALFNDELTGADLAAVREATKKGWALGGKPFREQIATMLGRRTIWSGRRWANQAAASCSANASPKAHKIDSAGL